MTLDLESELLGARCHCQDGHKRDGVRFYNQNLEAMTIFIHVHKTNQHTVTRVRCLLWGTH